MTADFDPLFLKSRQKLIRFRKLYIDAQIKAESGLKGKARKLGLGLGREISRLPYYSLAQTQYYQVLDQFRQAVIQKNFNSGQNDLLFIAALSDLTIFDEIDKLKEQKEKILRQKPVTGLIRTQAQTWRELNPGLKIIISLVIFAAAFFACFFAPGQIWLGLALFSCGLMIFLEGAQQKISNYSLSSKELDRDHAYQKARREIPSKKNNQLASQLALIHKKLEQDILAVRIHEKRSEYRRYLVSAFVPALILFAYFLKQGIQSVFFSLLAAISSRLAWFGLPLNSIKQGFADAFGLKSAEAVSNKSVQQTREPAIPDNPSNPEEIKLLVNHVSKNTGTPAEILWGMLKQESTLGKNTGHGHYLADMNPNQRKTFLEICQNLNLNPASTGVSQRPRNYSGWGGAMGPAQFIPTTWKMFDKKIAEIYGVEYANPWNFKHAVTAMGLKLAQDGATDPARKKEAIGRYFAGGNWRGGAAQRYINGVLAKSQDF